MFCNEDTGLDHVRTIATN